MMKEASRRGRNNRMMAGSGVRLGIFAAALFAALPAAAQQACPAFRWTTLGTAGGPVPTPERSEPANLLVAADQLILVDTGDGTVDQLAKLGLDLSHIRTVFISHHHWDHTGGLAAVIGLRWMNELPGVLTIYGPPGTKQLVAGIVSSLEPQSRIGFGVGALPAPPGTSVNVVEIGDGTHLTLGTLTVLAAANSHFAGAANHSAVPALSLSYRFQLGDRAITFTGDTGPSAVVAQLAKESDLLVSEVIDLPGLIASVRRTHTDLTPERESALEAHLTTHHLGALQVGALAADARVGHVVLTHFAVPPGPPALSERVLRDGIRTSFTGAVDLARDLQTFDVGCKASH